MKKKYLSLVSISLVLITLTLGGYFGVKKFLSDRQQLLSAQPVKRIFRTVPSSGTTKRTYTKQELEDMRKKGTLPRDLKQPYIPPNQAGDAAVQQSLRTIQEINKINEMNQRLMEQQQRQQRQNR